MKKFQTVVALMILISGISALIMVGSSIVKHEKYADSTEKLIEQDALA